MVAFLYILTLPLFQGMAIPCHKPFYDTKDGDGRLSENPSSGHRCRYSLLKITPPRFSVILLRHFYRDLAVYFTSKVYQYFNPKVYHFNLISKSVSLLGAVPPPTGKRAFLF